jgi:hypothetical protein
MNGENQINRICFLLVTCEEKFKDAEKFTYNENSLSGDIKKLMSTYNNWGELLAVAPRAISGLERLIARSHHPKMDFPIDDKVTPIGGFKHIKYPKSFQTTLLQIGHQGYLALLKAHINIDKIRMYNSNVSGHIKDAVRYLMSQNELYIVNLLPISIWHIKEAAYQSKEYLREVMFWEFGKVLELITETLVLAVRGTKTNKKMELERVGRDWSWFFGLRKTQQAINTAKRRNLEVIQALQEGVEEELTNLRTHWMKLKDFYSNMGVFITKATENLIELIEVVRVIARDLNVLDDDEIFGNLLEKIEKANEASFLVRGVSDMYVNVSIKYIMDQIASQGDIMASIDNSQVKIEEIRNDLMMSGIHDYIKADEISLRTRLVDRHNQINNEYAWTLNCSSPEDRAFIRKE